MTLELDKSGWTRVRFGDVADRNREQMDRGAVKRYVAGGHFDDGALEVTRYGEPDDGGMGSTFTYAFHPGHVLYVSASWYLRKVGVATFDGVVADKTYVIETRDPEVLDPAFLPWILLSDSLHTYSAAQSTGSMNARLLWTTLAIFEFYLPPLDEQKRIADLLLATERHRLAIKATMGSLDDAVVRRLTEAWKDDRDKRALGEIAMGVTGSTPSKSNKSYWNSEDVPFYTPSEIDCDTMRPARQRVSEAGAAAGRMLPEYSVAVACIGGAMGKSAVITASGVSNQQITSIVGLSEDDAYILQSLLAHPRGRAAMEARETTTIVRKLNKSDLMKVKVPWPEDRTDLREIVRETRGARQTLSTELTALAVLRSSLLSDVFGGD